MMNDRTAECMKQIKAEHGDKRQNRHKVRDTQTDSNTTCAVIFPNHVADFEATSHLDGTPLHKYKHSYLQIIT